MVIMLLQCWILMISSAWAAQLKNNKVSIQCVIRAIFIHRIVGISPSNTLTPRQVPAAVGLGRGRVGRPPRPQPPVLGRDLLAGTAPRHAEPRLPAHPRVQQVNTELWLVHWPQYWAVIGCSLLIQLDEILSNHVVIRMEDGNIKVRLGHSFVCCPIFHI